MLMSLLKVWFLDCSLIIYCASIYSSSRIRSNRQNNLIIFIFWFIILYFLRIFPQSMFNNSFDILFITNRLPLLCLLFVLDSWSWLYIFYNFKHWMYLIMNFINIFNFSNKLSIFACRFSWIIVLSITLRKY